MRDRVQGAGKRALRPTPRANAEGRNVSASTGRGYAPKEFADTEEAKAERIGNKDFAGAMERLFRAGKIINEKYGRPAEPRYRIVPR